MRECAMLGSGAVVGMIQCWVTRFLVGLLATGLLTGLGRTQEPSSASLQALVGPFVTKLAAIRGLSAVPAPPPVVIRSKAEMRRYMQERLDQKQPVARVEAERKAMLAWRLIPADFDLRGFLLDLLNEQALAYYDPAKKLMILADWIKIPIGVSLGVVAALLGLSIAASLIWKKSDTRHP